MTEVILRKRAARAGEIGLFAVDDDGADLLRKIKDNRDVGADVIQRRNPRHHRLYWACVKFTAMHAPRFEGVSLNKVHVALKLATGFVDTFVDAETGDTCYVPRSTSFAAMDQTEFNAFFDDACRVIACRWMPAGTTAEDVRAELIEMVDGPHAAALGSKIA
jgi:hypothetical protein